MRLNVDALFLSVVITYCPPPSVRRAGPLRRRHGRGPRVHVRRPGARPPAAPPPGPPHPALRGAPPAQPDAAGRPGGPGGAGEHGARRAQERQGPDIRVRAQRPRCSPENDPNITTILAPFYLIFSHIMSP